jgi:hypothetical protein
VQLAMRGMPGWGRHARQGGGAHGSGGRRERLTGGCARLWRGAQTGKGRACMGVEGARTANREGGRMDIGRARTGGDGGVHNGSLRQFQGLTVWLESTPPKMS